MNLTDPAPLIELLRWTRSAALDGESDPPSEQTAELAREFEALLLREVVREMSRTFSLDGGDDSGATSNPLLETIEFELARALSDAGGVGLAAVFEDMMGRTSPEVTPDPAAGLRVLDARAAPGRESRSDDTAVSFDRSGAFRLPVAAPLSSRYGWRQDPFEGTARFHGGIDLAAAYGEPVAAAGAGRVVFAGEQGGYGLTVVVEHQDGVTTRYAHLSALSVANGEVIRPGQAIGRVGQTGRATGPHLHFEVRRDGRTVNPMTEVGAGPTIKAVRHGADFPNDRPFQPVSE